jgi:hypothetical protein
LRRIRRPRISNRTVVLPLAEAAERLIRAEQADELSS